MGRVVSLALRMVAWTGPGANGYDDYYDVTSPRYTGHICDLLVQVMLGRSIDTVQDRAAILIVC